tara:strand:- start:72 stop:491 length:420 start_codon:yes stop_codon:yes gene_type:complete
MSEIQALSLAIEEAVKEQVIKLEKRDRFNLKLQADQRRTIQKLRRQISEHTAYVNSGKQQIDMIKLAQVVGKFDRETHLLEIVKLVPAIKHALCDKLECLLPWVHPMWVKKKITLVTGEDYAAACIALESLIMEAGRKD